MVPLRFIPVLLWMMYLSGKAQDRQLIIDGDPQQDSLSMEEAGLLIESWRAKGHLFAGVDSVAALSIYVHRGSIYNWRNSQGKKDIYRTLAELNNAGYPFARVARDSLILENQRLIYSPNITPGPYIVSDSLVFDASIPVKSNYLRKVLEMPSGSAYRTDDFERINLRIKRLSFLRLQSEPQVFFESGRALYYLDLAHIRNNRFEGILGVLPNQQAGGGSLVTGNIDLELDNLFRSGKSMELHWQRYANASQRLDFNYAHPFLLGSALGLRLAFGLVRQDSSFFAQSSHLGAEVYLSSLLGLEGFYETNNQEVLTTDSLEIIRNSWQEFDRKLYGFGLNWNRAADLNLLATDFKASMSLAFGDRDIFRNERLPESYYDTITFEASSVRVLLAATTLRTIGKTMALFGNWHGAFLSQANSLRNELFRPGGIRSIRGFNEQFFYTSFYLIQQLEWRWYFEPRSYFFLLYDQGWLQAPTQDYPNGLGLGLQLETQAGLFNFVLAGGRSTQQPFDFNNLKAHFGYTARF